MYLYTGTAQHNQLRILKLALSCEKKIPCISGKAMRVLQTATFAKNRRAKISR